MADHEERLPEELRAAGARRRQEVAPEEVDREWFADKCEDLERVIRLQSRSEDSPFELTERDERALSSPTRDPETMTGALRRWAYLKHLFLSRDEYGGMRHGGRAPFDAGEDGEEAAATREEAARKLIQREPVEVELTTGRTVQITGRSYAAMVRLAQHEMRIDELQTAAARAAQLRGEAIEGAESGDGSSLRLRRRAERLGRIHRRILQEITLHRRAMYAHATTEDGAPASGLEDAPEWWREMGPADDVILLTALFEAGPGRIQDLGPPPERNGDGRKDRDDWGFKSLLMSVERRQKLEPATLFYKDLGQVVSWVRGGAPPPPEELES